MEFLKLEWGCKMVHRWATFNCYADSLQILSSTRLANCLTVHTFFTYSWWRLLNFYSGFSCRLDHRNCKIFKYYDLYFVTKIFVVLSMRLFCTPSLHHLCIPLTRVTKYIHAIVKNKISKASSTTRRVDVDSESMLNSNPFTEEVTDVMRESTRTDTKH